MVMAGEAPDVVEMPDTWTAQYVANKMLVDLQPYLDTWSESKELSKKTMNMATLVGNKPYMVPYGFYLRALFLQQEIVC
jgi:multiple sugar transport system substrate-binding protein